MKTPKSAFRRSVLKNGLTVLTESHPEFRSVSMGIWVKAGTRHEKASESGVCHFLEHMLFKGTERRTALEIAREVDQVGGEFNAFTGREHTCFHLTLLDHDFALGIDILGDILLYSTFDGEELERERKVIQQEIAMVEDSPEELAQDLHFEMIFGRHGLGRPILGTESSIRRMKRSDLIRFFREHYRPDQLVLAVAGNVSHRAVMSKLKQLARKKWPGRAARRPSRQALGFEPAPKMKPGCWWITRRTEQVHIVWGVEGLRYSARDRFAAYLLNVYLGGGMSSALFQEIREKKGLAYTVYSSLTPFQDVGVFTIYVATSMKQVPTCLKLIEESFQRLRRELLPEDELEMVKENLKGTVLLGAESSESRMLSIGRNEISLGEYASPDQFCEAIDRLKPEDLRRVARKILGNPSPGILCLGPAPSRAVRAKLGPKRVKR